MSDEYQLRKDVDKLLGDIYDYNEGLKVALFREDSPLRHIGIEKDDEDNFTDTGTLDAILEYYGLLNIDEKLVDLTVGDINLNSLLHFSVDLEDNGTMVFNINLGGND